MGVVPRGRSRSPARCFKDIAAKAPFSAASANSASKASNLSRRLNGGGATGSGTSGSKPSAAGLPVPAANPGVTGNGRGAAAVRRACFKPSALAAAAGTEAGAGSSTQLQRSPALRSVAGAGLPWAVAAELEAAVRGALPVPASAAAAAAAAADKGAPAPRRARPGRPKGSRLPADCAAASTDAALRAAAAATLALLPGRAAACCAAVAAAGAEDSAGAARAASGAAVA